MRSFYLKTLAAITLIVLWCIAAWIISGNYFNARTDDQIRQLQQLTHDRVQDLADSIRRNLNYLGGVPGFFVHAVRVNNALAQFGPGNIPSSLPVKTQRARWIADPILKDLDQTLAIASANFHVDLIHIVNAAGDSVAASNWDTPFTPIGTNYAEREYFRMNKNGHRGQQYAVGRTTHVAGLFFSSPVFKDGKFLGAVVAKTDVPNLSFLIKQTDSFVTDKNGVIILSHDKDKEMLSLAGSAVGKMSDADKVAMYDRKDFPELHITSWGMDEFPSLLRMQGESFPQVLASKALPEYGLTVYVEGDLPTIVNLAQERSLYFLFSSALGSLLILLVYGGLSYLHSINLAREDLRASEKRFRTLASGAFEGIAISSKGNFIDVNNQLTQILGYDRNEIVGHPIIDFIAPEDQTRVMANIKVGIESNIEHEMLRKDGSHVLVESHGQTIVQGGIPIRLTAIRDITDRKLIEIELQHRAHIDYLTGVSNRGHFMEQAELELSRAVRYGSSLSLYMLDVDFFKKVNDSYGHKVGDLVLIKLAEVCRETLREVDIIGRLGGEEFAILLPETNQVKAAEVAERLREAIAKAKIPLESGLPLNFTVSIGVTSLVSKDDNLDVLLNHADRALYEAKESGRNRVCVAKQ